ncbi:MAG TPA: hypothetical protein VH413_07775 [Verrucomicrobiae bacterium]|jgi:hypothetical protein|nr:hypothetical protein [Verrucomicrobiae bacterium]
MKTKSVIAVLTLLLGIAAAQSATTVTATGNGEWNSTVPDQPWPGGVPPQPTDNADIEAPFNVTVSTNATVDYIYGSGTVTMGTNATLTIVGSNAGEGTQSLGLIDTTAPGNTVIYQGNAFFCKHQNYYNLQLVGFGNLFNGEIGVSGDGLSPMTISGNFILGGTAGVAQGDMITTMGDLTIGPGSTYDSSCSPVTVMGNTVVSGTLEDKCGDSVALDDVFNNITINPGGTWNLGDVIEWAVNGSVTNNGSVIGTGFGTITFLGTGVIAGNSPLTPPFVSFQGTNEIENTIEVTTNGPDFKNTIVLDFAHPGEIIVPMSLNMQLFFSGTLNLTNTGPAITRTTTYKFFDAIGYNDPYGFNTINGPGFGANYSITNDLTIDGTITVVPLTLAAGITNNQITLSWDSVTFPGFQLQVQTNTAGLAGTNWLDVGASSSPFTTAVSSTNAAVLFRLSTE